MKQVNNYLIICGSFRSGTSITCSILARHSELLLTNELWSFKNIGTINRKISRLREVYPNMGGSKATIAPTTLGDNYENFLQNHAETPIKNTEDLFERLLKFSGKSPKYVGDKLPEYVLELPSLVERFNRPKILVCIRDGRDVIESQTKRWKYFMDVNGRVGNNWWAKRTIDECIDMPRSWLHYMKVWDNVKHSLNADYCEVYFRNLANDVESETRKISEFLGINAEETLSLFKTHFKPQAYQAWREKFPEINDKLPQEWKNMLIKYGFEL